MRQLGTPVGESRRCRIEVLADNSYRIVVLKRRRTGEKVKRGGSQGILVGAAIDLCTHQLFGRGIGKGADGEIGRRKSADVAEWSCNAEVGQQNSSPAVLGLGEQDVGRFDIPMQQPALVGVVKRVGDSGNDGAHVPYRHTGSVAVFQELAGIGALDVIHCNPKASIELPAIMYADDVRVPQPRGQVGLAVEPFTEVVVSRHRLRHDF
ncbi:hypothetical protein A5696_07250 [Mycobacterium sp. E2699]|nr:hypothetical protein A5696_07250 [Mycobacterium sp. E2699]OBI51755.1 hypothetical protein A5705_00400 [Mycobacterium sp. E787]